MKHIGCCAEYAEARAKDLLNVYLTYITHSKHISMTEVYQAIPNKPARRFYVSEMRATAVVGKIMQGDRLLNMHPCKREMFFEIYNRYKRIKDNFKGFPLSHIIGIIIEQPAPKFYITSSSAKLIVIKARKKWYEERRKKLYRYL